MCISDSVLLINFNLCVGGRQWLQDVLNQVPQLAVDSGCVRDDEAEAVLVVGRVDGYEEIALLRDAFPLNFHEAAAVPDLIELTVGVAFFNQDDVTVIFGVVWLARRGVLGDEPIDEVFDGGICRMVFWELCEVFGGFDCDHIYGPP